MSRTCVSRPLIFPNFYHPSKIRVLFVAPHNSFVGIFICRRTKNLLNPIYRWWDHPKQPPSFLKLCNSSDYCGNNRISFFLLRIPSFFFYLLLSLSFFLPTHLLASTLARPFDIVRPFVRSTKAWSRNLYTTGKQTDRQTFTYVHTYSQSWAYGSLACVVCMGNKKKERRRRYGEKRKKERTSEEKKRERRRRREWKALFKLFPRLP